MKPILLVYASREGQTQRIAEYIREKIYAHNFSATLWNAQDIPAHFSLEPYQAVILAGSVHGGKHERELVHFVQCYRTALEQKPTMLLSVSLSQAGVQDPKATLESRHNAEADVQHMINVFLAETQWHPTLVKSVAGALRYRRYNFFVRWIMRSIARRAGASTDTSRDHVFTHWQDLDAFVGDFLQIVTRQLMEEKDLLVKS